MNSKLKFRYYSILWISALLMMGVSCDDDDDGTGMVADNTITLDLVAEGLTSPLVVVESPDNTGRLFVVDQVGLIYIIKDGEKIEQPFLDIAAKIVTAQDERGTARVGVPS